MNAIVDVVDDFIPDEIEDKLGDATKTVMNVAGSTGLGDIASDVMDFVKEKFGDLIP